VGTLLKPKTVKRAAELGSKPGFAFLGGGTRLNGKNSSTDITLVSLENLGLSSIEKGPAELSLGATVILQSIMDHPDIPWSVRGAVSLYPSRTLRNMMTVGGELGSRSPCSPLLAALTCLDAEVRLALKRKTVGIEEHIGGASPELILAALVRGEGLRRSCRTEVLRRTSHAPASLVAAVAVSRRDPVLSIRIVVGDREGAMTRLRGAEKALEGRPLPGKGIIEDEVRKNFSPKPDIHASAEYKLYMAGVMIADMLDGLCAGGGGR
jgi:probable selenate reductase FAD-binding subunit